MGNKKEKLVGGAWPSFNQLLCATLPEEVQSETRIAQSLLLHQHDRTAD